MIKRRSSFILAIFSCLLGISVMNFTWHEAPAVYTGDAYVYQVLLDLGMPKPIYFPQNITDENIRMGKEMVFNGHTEKPDGSRSKYISLYYVCTNCHNTVIEDPVLTISDPDTRLTFAKEYNIRFLQGTTFYGAVNRETWYNDDYYKKYGDLVKPAKNDIREAIQLCAKECSKGRHLEQWEVDAILAYYYSISYRLSDIMGEAEVSDLNQKIKNKEDHNSIIALIKSKYALKSPATFVEPPYDKSSSLPQGNPENGKAIFELSCQQCHKPYGCSDVIFDDSQFTFNKFAKDFDKNYWWLFEAVRHGFYGYPGHEPYMPHYTAQRMSDQQVMDLKAYFLSEASK